MKNILIVLVVVGLLGVGCGKSNIADYSPASLIGTWSARDTSIQFSIFTTEGKGDDFVNYLEIKNDKGRYLETTFKGHKTTYEVLYVTRYLMSLQDSTTRQLYFNKIGD